MNLQRPSNGSPSTAVRIPVAPTISQKDIDPDFEGPIQNVTVAVGREAVLTCTVSDLGLYKVGWMRAEDQTILTLHTRVVTHSARYSVTHDTPATWRLHIRPVREPDRGCYMCQINTSTMKKQVGCIDVHDRSKSIVFGPWKNGVVYYNVDLYTTQPNLLMHLVQLGLHFIEKRSCLTFERRAPLMMKGNFTFLNFAFTGVYENCCEQHYEHKFYGKRMVVLSPRCNESHEVAHAILHGMGLKHAPDARFLFSDMKRILFPVQCQHFLPPDIVDAGTSGDREAREGGGATLQCRAAGRPAPRILWRREDGGHIVLRENDTADVQRVDVYSGSTLNLTKIDRKQMGAYLCIASNDVPPSVSKRIMLQVNFPPSVLVANQLLGVPTGSDANLECFVEAFPATVNYWMKNRGEILLDGRNYEISEERISAYQLRLLLIIREFSKADLGTYMCVSTNTLGKGDGTVRLYEIKVTTTTTTTTTTTSTTTTTTSTPLPTTTTVEMEIINVPRVVVPLPPAEQKVYPQDVTTYDSIENVIEQSVLDNTWLATGAPREHHENYASDSSQLRAGTWLTIMLSAICLTAESLIRSYFDIYSYTSQR